MTELATLADAKVISFQYEVAEGNRSSREELECLTFLKHTEYPDMITGLDARGQFRLEVDGKIHYCDGFVPPGAQNWPRADKGLVSAANGLPVLVLYACFFRSWNIWAAAFTAALITMWAVSSTYTASGIARHFACSDVGWRD